MKPKILISAPYLQKQLNYYIDDLKRNFELVIPDVNERLNENELFEIFHENNWEISGAIVGDDDFSKSFYDKAYFSSLKVIVKWGTGIDSLNKNYAEKNNIKILNTPSAFTIPVSESAIGLMLNFCRKITESNNKMKEGKWEKVKGYTLDESSVGIIGLGDIGSHLAQKLEVFNCNISYYDPFVNNYKYNKYTDLNELLKNNDIISIHCNLNEETKHLINKNNLNFLENKVLINTARGSIINNKDLEEFSKENTVYVGLDVFEKEPLEKNHWFRKCENFILSSHNTNTSDKYWKKVHENSIKLLKNEL